jgi:Icc-related predicted phosphoesterase
MLKSRGRCALRMRLLVYGDLHGNVPDIPDANVDAILAPGDFCSTNIADRMDSDNWYEDVGKEAATTLIEQALHQGRRVLETLNSAGVPVFVVPGSLDWAGQEAEWNYLEEDHFESIIEGLPNVVNCHNWIADATDYQVVGKGVRAGPEYPQRQDEIESYSIQKLKRVKEQYEEEYEKIGGLLEQATKPVVFLSHKVPYETLDDNGDKPTGSVLARELIEEYQPALCVGGHDNGVRDTAHIGKTTIVNAGNGVAPTVIDVDGASVVDVDFHDE